jgi:hypothetical protein
MPKDTRTMIASTLCPSARYEIRFESLFEAGRALAFPCSADGQVALDRLNARALNNYLYARALVGRDYATPVVLRRDLH